MKDYGNSQISEIIDEYIHKERDRAILKSRLCDGLTYEELSAKYDLSTQRIKAIIYKGQDKVFRYL